MNKYRDFDNYLKEYPTEDGYFGKYGGNYLDDPDLIQAFKEYAEGYNTIAQSDRDRYQHDDLCPQLCRT